MKRLEQNDADSRDEEEEPSKRPRTRFVTLQPGGDDPADAIDDEIPGSVRVDVEPLVLAGEPFSAYPAGDSRLSASHMATDPGFARAQRKLLRMHAQDEQALELAAEGEEAYDQPEEAVNEAGDPVEPFHLKKEREEGFIDKEGTYIEYDRPGERDAWLDSIEDQVEGTENDASGELPYSNEPVLEDPAPLPASELRRWQQLLVGAMQPGEDVAAALCRLAGGGQVLEKFGDKAEAAKAWRERMHSGHTVAPGNQPLFDQVTEAAEVLFDAGQMDVYSATREALHRQLAQDDPVQREAAPPEAAPTAAATAAAAAAVEGGRTAEQTRRRAGQDTGTAAAGARPRGIPVPGAGGRRAGDEVMGMREVQVLAAGGSDKELDAEGQQGRQHASRRALRGEPQPAAAAAALLPEGGMPSVPGAEREPRGQHQEGAVHGFAAQLPADVLAEAPVTAPPPQEVEAGLGLPGASPTAVELQQRRAQEEAGGERAGNELPIKTAAEGSLKAAQQGTFGTQPGAAQHAER